MTLADRLVVMNAGVAEQIGTPMDIYERPASVFVAGFIGSPPMNILETHVGDDGASVTIEGMRIDLGQAGLAVAGKPCCSGFGRSMLP